ncbi:hypothetical protein ABKN59_001996 [Abortiporus biennis]
MDPPRPPSTLPFTEEELKRAGLLGDDVSEDVKRILQTMREHPGMLRISLSSLQRINTLSKEQKESSSSGDVNMAEGTSSHNGNTGEYYYPGFIYRSDLPASFSTNEHAQDPNFSLRPVSSNSPLKPVWETVGHQICALLRERKIKWSCMDPFRPFFEPSEEEWEGTYGPVVISIGVRPGSTTADTAREASDEILSLLLKNGVEDVVVEFAERVVERY